MAVSYYVGTEKCQLTFASSEPLLPPGRALPLWEAQQGVSSPPSQEPGLGWAGFSHWDLFRAEEHGPGRPGRSMGWGGPAHPGRRRGHLLALAASLLLICAPGEWAGLGPGEEGADGTGGSGVPNTPATPGAARRPFAFWQSPASPLAR